MPMYFYVQRNGNSDTSDTPTYFELDILNIGDATNLKSGIFTAPRLGIYFFSFSGVSRSNTINVSLYVNNNRIGSGHGLYSSDTFTVQSALQLDAGDEVSVQMDDEDYHHYMTTSIIITPTLSVFSCKISRNE